MNQKYIDQKAKELFDAINHIDRPDIAFAVIRKCLEEVSGIAEDKDIQTETEKWTYFIYNKYKNYDSDNLTQVHMRGHFAGFSEREIFELAKRLKDNARLYPIHQI